MTKQIEQSVLDRLNRHQFPGNVRELKNLQTLHEVRYLKSQLEKYSWNISAVARQLGMRQPNLSRKIKELGIKGE